MNSIEVKQKRKEQILTMNYSTNLIKSLGISQADIDRRFEYYYGIPQPPQKSQAWLDQRTNFITASSFGHALTPRWTSPRNELLKNKVSKGSYNTFKGNEATRWGEKYEDICCAIYCYRHGVEVNEFGLIPHPKYPFLGASTDGITSKLINLEIKSPFSRKIEPGKVKPIYWQQMQLQMDVLDLELSHFLECSFREYPSARDFWLDFERSDHKYPEKGVIIEYVNLEVMSNEGVPKMMYLYSPVEMCGQKERLQIWEKQQIAKMISGSKSIYIRSHYWILAMYSCVNVARDREWFNSQIPKFVEFWEDVEKYRKNGGLEKLTEDIEREKLKKNSDKTKVEEIKVDLTSSEDDPSSGNFIVSSDDEEDSVQGDDCSVGQVDDSLEDGESNDGLGDACLLGGDSNGGSLKNDSLGDACLLDSSSSSQKEQKVKKIRLKPRKKDDPPMMALTKENLEQHHRRTKTQSELIRRPKINLKKRETRTTEESDGSDTENDSPPIRPPSERVKFFRRKKK